MDLSRFTPFSKNDSVVYRLAFVFFSFAVIVEMYCFGVTVEKKVMMFTVKPIPHWEFFHEWKVFLVYSIASWFKINIVGCQKLFEINI